MKIKQVSAWEILDSRGNPTVKATVTLENGVQGSAMVPSGASTGKYEAVELRDNDLKRFNGLGVLTAVNNVNQQINKSLAGLSVEDQTKIDQTMIDLDGTENKSKLGANAILAVSLAAARAASMVANQPLYRYLTKFNPDFNGKYIMPIPQFNVMNGGKHANWATDIQEYMILPTRTDSITTAIRMAAEVYQNLKKVLKEKKYAISVGDEGGFAPAVSSNEEPFQLLSEAITAAGYLLGKDISFGIDSAASEFFENGKYNLKKELAVLSGDQLIDFYSRLHDLYPIVSYEDIFEQDDWESFQKFTQKYGKTAQIVGDDLYVTNVKRIQEGINKNTTNSVLIKLNQIGTLTETIDAILLARKYGMSVVVSHRSGETEDSFIADLVVGLGTGQIKTGAPCRGERTAKYNRLMEIELEQKGNISYAEFPFRG